LLSLLPCAARFSERLGAALARRKGRVFLIALFRIAKAKQAREPVSATFGGVCESKCAPATFSIDANAGERLLKAWHGPPIRRDMDGISIGKQAGQLVAGHARP
jgi:hypothetical protein